MFINTPKSLTQQLQKFYLFLPRNNNHLVKIEKNPSGDPSNVEATIHPVVVALLLEIQSKCDNMRLDEVLSVFALMMAKRSDLKSLVAEAAEVQDVLKTISKERDIPKEWGSIADAAPTIREAILEKPSAPTVDLMTLVYGEGYEKTIEEAIKEGSEEEEENVPQEAAATSPAPASATKTSTSSIAKADKVEPERALSVLLAALNMDEGGFFSTVAASVAEDIRTKDSLMQPEIKRKEALMRHFVLGLDIVTDVCAKDMTAHISKIKESFNAIEIEQAA